MPLLTGLVTQTPSFLLSSNVSACIIHTLGAHGVIGGIASELFMKPMRSKTLVGLAALEVEQPVEIPEIHWEEDIVLIPEWTREEVVKTVPRTTVTEVIRPVVKTIEKVCADHKPRLHASLHPYFLHPCGRWRRRSLRPYACSGMLQAVTGRFPENASECKCQSWHYQVHSFTSKKSRAARHRM
eukprot:6470195-Amphidinium_carterae.1